MTRILVIIVPLPPQSRHRGERSRDYFSRLMPASLALDCCGFDLVILVEPDQVFALLAPLDHVVVGETAAPGGYEIFDDALHFLRGRTQQLRRISGHLVAHVLELLSRENRALEAVALAVDITNGPVDFTRRAPRFLDRVGKYHDHLGAGLEP